MNKFVLFAGVSLLATQAAAFENTYTNLTLSYSNQEDLDEEVIFLGETFFKQDSVTLGFGAFVNKDVISDTSNSVVWGHFGYDVTSDLYLQASLAAWSNDTRQGIVYGEYRLGTKAFGLEHRVEADTDWSRTDLMVGTELSNTYVGAEVRVWGTPGNKRGFLAILGETEIGAVDLSFSGGFGILDNDYRELGVSAEYAMNDKFDVIGGFGVRDWGTNRDTHLGLGGRYSVTDSIGFEALVSREFEDDGDQWDTVGFALVMETGRAPTLEVRHDYLDNSTWNAIRAYD